MKMLSLFSGIGGIDLAAEWAGIETVAFCEIAEYPVKVLKKNWPGVRVYDDVRAITREKLKTDGIQQIDIVAGGFPCQPFSCAGQRQGQEDERFLWPEMLRIVGETKPKWVLGENVGGLLSIADVSGKPGGTFGTILYDLAELGYSTGWACYGACEVGALHQRERVFIIAHTNSDRLEGNRQMPQKTNGTNYIEIASSPAINAAISLWNTQKTDCDRIRENDGVSNWMDRIKALGNAVVPQQIYPIFKAIMDVERGVLK